MRANRPVLIRAVECPLLAVKAATIILAEKPPGRDRQQARPQPPLVQAAAVGRKIQAAFSGSGTRNDRIYFVAMHLVRFWHKADISRLSPDVRFWG